MVLPVSGNSPRFPPDLWDEAAVRQPTREGRGEKVTHRSPGSEQRPGHIPVGSAGEDRWLLVAVAGLLSFVAMLDMNIVNVALADIADGLHVSAATAQWTVLGYQLPVVALLLPVGRWLDARSPGIACRTVTRRYATTDKPAATTGSGADYSDACPGPAPVTPGRQASGIPGQKTTETGSCPSRRTSRASGGNPRRRRRRVRPRRRVFPVV